MSKEITLTEAQKRVLKQLEEFATSDQRYFILRGYAGTGKTTMVRFFIRFLRESKIDFQLLAPTGRAAKVLTDIALEDRFEEANDVGQTIHSLIYNYTGMNREVTDEEIKTSTAAGQLMLMFEHITLDPDKGENKPVVYIVDEASMISDVPSTSISQAIFGSGRLLTELTEFDQRPASKFLFVGDPCQLPPVGSAESPALTESTFTPPAQSASLTEIMRQEDGCDLIRISKQIRGMVQSAPDDEAYYGGRNFWTKLPLRNSASIVLHHTADELTSSYVADVKQNGYNNSIFICRSNKDNSTVSAGVRAALGYTGAMPQKGELLLVIQNNYPTGLVNGDMVVVEDVKPLCRQHVGLTFLEATVKECVTNRSFKVLLMLDTLWSNQLNLTQVQQTSLFVDFIVRMRNQGIHQKSQRFVDAMRRDPYLNALRCDYGYSVTCHKAQGGEWDDVYLKLPRNIGLNPTKQSYRWLYTAITRARRTLHIVDDYLYLQ